MHIRTNAFKPGEMGGNINTRGQRKFYAVAAVELPEIPKAISGLLLVMPSRTFIYVPDKTDPPNGL